MKQRFTKLSMLWVTFNFQVVCVIILVFIFIWRAENTRSWDLKWRLFGLGVALILIEHASNTQTRPFTNQNVFLLALWCRRGSSGVAAGCCMDFNTIQNTGLLSIKHMWYPTQEGTAECKSLQTFFKWKNTEVCSSKFSVFKENFT